MDGAYQGRGGFEEEEDVSSFSDAASRTEHPREEEVLRRRRTCRRSVALLRRLCGAVADGPVLGGHGGGGVSITDVVVRVAFS